MSRNFYSKILDQDQTEQIHENALKILAEIGTEIYNTKALEILGQAGAEKVGEMKVRIPRRLVEEAIKSAPEQIDLFSRNGDLTMQLGGDPSYFGLGPTCPYVYDLVTHERRLFTRQDCINGALLGDSLSNIDFVMSMGSISDAVPRSAFELDAFYCLASHTDKPLMISAVDENDLAVIYEISCMIKGGQTEVRNKPFYIQYCEPTTPLKHSDTALQKLMFCSERNIPLVYTPAPSAGGTAPVTMAGALALGTAEILAGLVINQLISKGAPFIYGGVFSIIDMKTMNFSYGAPEFLLFTGCLADMARYYKLPSFTTGGVSDAKSFDQQAAGEYALSLFTAYMSGSSLIHDVGYIEGGLTGSYEGIIYADEIIGMIKRINQGLQVNPETLAFDVIKEAGVGGFFLDKDHTYRNFKHEQWFPSLLNRASYNQWSSHGREDLLAVLNRKALNVLDNSRGHGLDSLLNREIRALLSRHFNV
jgi:trimethylamine---corrinoid protein Co-methyltransferase